MKQKAEKRELAILEFTIQAAIAAYEESSGRAVERLEIMREGELSFVTVGLVDRAIA